MPEITTATSGSINEIGGFRLDGTPADNAFYFVDYTKLKSVEDLILILGAVGFNFHTSHPHFDLVKPFLDLENPIQPK